MINGLDEVQKAGQDSLNRAMESFDAYSKGLQAIASEAAEYSKRSYEAGAAHFEDMADVKTLDKAIEKQRDYLKSAYEGAIAQATKISELYADFAKLTVKPFEGFMPKAGK